MGYLLYRSSSSFSFHFSFLFPSLHPSLLLFLPSSLPLSLLPQSLKLSVVVEPTVLEDELIMEDEDFSETMKKLKTWTDGTMYCIVHVWYMYMYINCSCISFYLSCLEYDMNLIKHTHTCTHTHTRAHTLQLLEYV